MKKLLLKKGIKFIIITLFSSFIFNSLKKNKNKIKKALKGVFSFKKNKYSGFLWTKKEVVFKTPKEKFKDISNLFFEIKISFLNNINEIKNHFKTKNSDSNSFLYSIMGAVTGGAIGTNFHDIGHINDGGFSDGDSGSSSGE